MGLVLKICGNEWNTASRDKRELSVYRELGHEIVVMAKGTPTDNGKEEIIDGFKVLRLSTRPLGPKFPDSINRAISLFMWAKYARKLKPDVISGHDLMPGLTIAWISTWLQKQKPLLVYDAHEFELGRNTDGKRKPITKWLLSHEEKMLMKRCAFTIMVNDTIADEVQRIYRLNERPIVVRSTPDKWIVDDNICEKIRRDYISTFKQKSVNNCRMEDPFLIMYHGAVTSGRGIETLIRLVSINPNIRGIVLGNGGKKYTQGLIELTKSLDIEDRILFEEAVPNNELWKYVGAVDLSIMVIQATAKSYYYALPNKFFESIQSLTPILCSDFPEMKCLIDKYNIGLTCNPENLRSINEAVEKMRIDREFYNSCKANLIRAKEELCWEKEKQILVKAVSEKLYE